MLHRKSSNKKLKDLVLQMTNSEDILYLLLNVAQFEYVLKKMFTGMLEQKEKKWNVCKDQCKERMLSLSEYYSKRMKNFLISFV